MSFPRAFPVVCVLAAGVLAGGCAESPAPSTGWGLTDLPETSPTHAQVLDAARGVIQERYPMSAASKEGSFVYALSPVEMNGGSKTRKQISVTVLRNFTGAYEPVVRVRQYVEVGMPELGANPESGNAVWAAPLARNEWQAVDFLPYEEQEIYDAILARLQGAES